MLGFPRRSDVVGGEDFADAAGDDFGEVGFAFFGEESAVVGGDGFEVCGVVLAEGFVGGEGFFEVAAGP